MKKAPLHELSLDKLAELEEIRLAHPGTSAEAQCARIRAALSKFPLSTHDARIRLDVYHAPARVLQLRKAGHKILTSWVVVVTEPGSAHRVGIYSAQPQQGGN